jgi:ETC complex I subunit conserved region
VAQNYRLHRDVCGARLVAIVAWSVYTTVTSPQFDSPMPARIYKPSKTAMQSGSANTKSWVLDFEPEAPRRVEPLMGWTSSGDMRQQLRLHFGTSEEAIAYCERHGIAYQVFETTPVKRRAISYADNFSFRRRDAWTH